MKHLITIILIFFSVSMFSQVPKDFNVRVIDNVDSALFLLTKAARQQHKKVPFSVDVTKEYFSQSREKVKGNVLTGHQDKFQVPKVLYYESITRVHIYVRNGWEIYITSKTMGVEDYILLKDKKTAENAYSALLCLIKNSGNSNYDNIVKPPKRK